MKRREKKAIINTLAETYYFAISAFTPFLIRRLLIQNIGVEYAGVSSLFQSVLQVLSFSDFGAGSLILFFLYSPFARKEYDDINAISAYMRHIFIWMGWIILGCGVSMIPLLPFFVQGKEYPPGLNYYAIYIVYILSTAGTYLLGIHSYNTLYAANIERAYLVPLINGTAIMIMYIVQALVLIIKKDYYIYSVLILIPIFIAFIFYRYDKSKNMSWHLFLGKVSDDFKKKFWKKTRGMIVIRMRDLSRNSLDAVVISTVVGLTALAKYQNYYQLMLVPVMLLGIMKKALNPVLGNSIALENRESSLGIFNEYTLLQNGLATVSAACLITIIQPVMVLWLGKKYLLPTSTVVCITVYFYLIVLSENASMLRTVTGIWEKGQSIAIIETVSNLILNIAFVKIWGVNGVILASIITVALINVPIEFYYVFRLYFGQGYFKYMIKQVAYGMGSFITVYIVYRLCELVQITGFKGVLLDICLSVVVSICLFFAFHFYEKEMKGLSRLALGIVRIIMNSVQSFVRSNKH